MADDERTKYCPKCKTTKTASEFYRAPSRPGGLQPRCKECANETVNVYRRQRTKNDPEYRERVNARRRELYYYWLQERARTDAPAR